MALALIDIGGTSIKFGVWENSKIIDQTAAATPKTLNEFYEVLNQHVTTMKNNHHITGVGISSPGSVDAPVGIIRGASAIPYIHNFEIVPELEKRFGLKIGIENDANCAGLAEVAHGAASGVKDAVFLVIGSGIGGAVIINGQVRHGAHLLGGEFGYMLHNEASTVSESASPVYMAENYNREESPAELKTGHDIFDAAANGEKTAQKYLDKLYYALAKTIFNLQYSIDPECFVLGGGISNSPQLLPGVEKALDGIMKQVEIAEVRPTIKICEFRSTANLIGAAVNYFNNVKGN
ncbi:ROK family protein [Lacticaseibacillus pantheris]|jgi:predicted NBD/HSP70 family sugar kinase|uniref:ROK family protein n=1 Tax=Lacticaseibacillus pantheris TaxID=171523 RepID=UPI00265B6B14|nr:ROK family protein [Lacticaseibacillus pantheris]WKF85236.1 ROK family protein [Lacticaseibacillus pantheris]